MSRPPASKPTRSLSRLPRSVWRSTLGFLSAGDALQLCPINRRIQGAWEDTLRSSAVTIHLRTTRVYGTNRGYLPAQGKTLLERFGQWLTWVRFVANHLALSQTTFRCLLQWVLANRGVLCSLHVDMLDLFKDDFIRDVEDGEETWVRIWVAVRNSDAEVTVHVNMFEPSFCIHEFFFKPLSVHDVRNDVVTELGFSCPLPVHTQLRVPYADPTFTPLTEFLTSFSNLRRLYLRLQEIDDVALDQLSQGSYSLTELEIHYKSVWPQPWFASDGTWAALAESLPALKVKCFLSEVYLSQENLADLNRVFKPSTPLYAVEVVSPYDPWEAVLLASWCKKFKTLRHVSFRMMGYRDDACTEEFFAAWRRLIDVSPHLETMTCKTESRGSQGPVMHTCRVTSKESV